MVKLGHLCEAYFVGSALAAHSEEASHITELQRFATLNLLGGEVGVEGLKLLQTAGSRRNVDLDVGVRLGLLDRQEAGVTGSEPAYRQLVGGRSLEAEGLAIGAFNGVGDRVERELAGESHSGDDVRRSANHCQSVDVDLLSEMKRTQGSS